jgi:ATP adenylyltransferase
VTGTSGMGQRLWAPWRMAWIDRATASARRGARGPAAGRRAGGGPRATRRPAAAACLFCRVSRGRADRRDHVLARTPHALLMLNRFPYNPGHLMVAIRRHAAQFQDLGAEEAADLLALTAVAERALAAEYHPHGVNYGVNVGRVAGAGFPGHLHLHVVPRWDGDTNFMPAVAATRVLPESLDRTWRRLRRAISELEEHHGATR